MQKAKAKAGIGQDGSMRMLRHSFATHLSEKGIDIRYIKDLLGHFSIKTIEKYLHVKREALIIINIPNILDEINKNITLDWQLACRNSTIQKTNIGSNENQLIIRSRKGFVR